MKPMTNLIGIVGKKGAGKDTVAGMLKKCLPYDIDSFAAPIRDFGEEWFYITHENRDKEVFGIEVTGREFLQRIGTEAGRSIHPDLFIHALAARWNKKLLNPVIGGPIGLIIPDLRFRNEAQFIHDNGGCILHVVRPELDELDSHSSEAGISTSSVDFTVCNYDNLANLEASVHQFARWFLQSLPKDRITQAEAFVVRRRSSKVMAMTNGKSEVETSFGAP